MRRVVVAVGGNALIRGDRESMGDQYAAVTDLAPQLVDLAADGHELVVTHGNGPQVGYILRRSELAVGEVAPIPIDFAVGDTQGAIGHMFLLALRNELHRRGIDRPVAALVTEVLVDAGDPAFAAPTKPIGSFLDEARARTLERQLGWTVVEDSGRGWRRVVASPVPIDIIDGTSIRALLAAGAIVVAAGGGGIPVTVGPDGVLERAEAVVDKDLTSALLGDRIGATDLVILTTTEAVAVGFGRPDQRWLDQIGADEAEQLLRDGEFAAGSMRPKIEAALQFVRGGPRPVRSNSGEPSARRAVVTSPARLVDALRGNAGTRIVNSATSVDGREGG